jgi:hypothetical protein
MSCSLTQCCLAACFYCSGTPVLTLHWSVKGPLLAGSGLQHFTNSSEHLPQFFHGESPTWFMLISLIFLYVVGVWRMFFWIGIYEDFGGPCYPSPLPSAVDAQRSSSNYKSRMAKFPRAWTRELRSSIRDIIRRLEGILSTLKRKIRQKPSSWNCKRWP